MEKNIVRTGRDVSRIFAQESEMDVLSVCKAATVFIFVQTRSLHTTILLKFPQSSILLNSIKGNLSGF